jgi:hypothetical protein
MRAKTMRCVAVMLLVGVTLGGLPAASEAFWWRFTGLWAGVDPQDGSLTRFSILCAKDRHCKVLGSDTFFSFCASSNGRGSLEGTGTISGTILRVPGLTLTCANADTFSVNASFHRTYRYGHPTLVQEVDDASVLPITLHKISR